MPKITLVEPQKKNPKRFNIFLDNKFAFGADEDLVVERRLIVGKEFDASEVEKLLFESEVGKLMERMYGLFNIRQRSEKEVRDYLRNLSFKRKIKDKEEVSEIVIESLIEKLKNKKLLNDQQFANSWVDARRKSKKKGKIAISAELYQKGIPKKIIDNILEQTTSESELELAIKSIEKKWKIWVTLPYLEKKKKAYDYLMRKGFEYETIKEAVEKILKLE